MASGNVLDSFIAHNRVGGEEVKKDKEKSSERKRDKSSDNKGKKPRSGEKVDHTIKHKGSIAATGHNSKAKSDIFKMATDNGAKPTGLSSSTDMTTGQPQKSPTGQRISSERTTGPTEDLPTGQTTNLPSTSMLTEQNSNDNGFAALNRQLSDFMGAMTQHNAVMSQNFGQFMEFFMKPCAGQGDTQSDEEQEGDEPEDNPVVSEHEADGNEEMLQEPDQGEGVSTIDKEMSRIRNDYDKEVAGPPVTSKMADLVTDMLQGSLSVQQINEKLDKFKRPSNLPYLTAPLVNERVWKIGTIKTETKGHDVKLQTIQKMLCAGMVPLIRAVDTLCGTAGTVSKEKKDDLAVELLGSLQMLTQTCHTINNKRKDLIKEDLPKKLKPMCSHSEKVTRELFGDEIDKTMDNLEKVKSYKYEASSFRGKAPRNNFLGQRGGFGHPQDHFMGARHQYTTQRGYAPQERTQYFPQQRGGFGPQRGVNNRQRGSQRLRPYKKTGGKIQ